MKNRLLISLIVLASMSTSALAYNDYGYSYGVATPYSGGFNSSMHIREMENDFYRSQAANRPSMDATVNSLGMNSSKVYGQSCSSPSLSSSRNPNRDYVQDRPLSLKGIGPYDAYGN